MSNVVAINGESAERIKELREQAIKNEMVALLKTDPEVKAAMVKKTVALIEEMSMWTLNREGGFTEFALQCLKEEPVKAAFTKAVIQCVESMDKDGSGNAHWRIYEAIGQALVEKMNVKVEA